MTSQNEQGEILKFHKFRIREDLIQEESLG